MKNDADLCFSSAVELAALVRRRELSPLELTAAFLNRIEALNPILNAYITVCDESALSQARHAEQAIMDGAALGPLHGVPFAVKDLLYTRGIRSTGGSRIYADHIPDQDAVVVTRLRAAGAILLGKTSTPEFGFKSTTENALIGTTCNPWDLTRTAGGSSGGAGAATAAGLAPLSVGTDAGGSIRTPASFCGIVGFKPSFGRVPNGPGFGGGASIVHTGPMTRTVSDAALMLAVMAGPVHSDRRTLPASSESFLPPLTAECSGLRIGYSADLGYAAVDREVAKLLEAAISDLNNNGWRIQAAALTLDDPQAPFNTIIRAENYVAAHPLVRDHADLLDPGMRTFTDNGAAVTALEYLDAERERDRLVAALAAWFVDHDILITPALAVPPFVHGQRPTTINAHAVSGMDWLSFTYPFNLSGHPAACIPCGWTADGLPVGMQVVGRRFADRRVLEVCAAIERERPWNARRPPAPGAQR